MTDLHFYYIVKKLHIKKRCYIYYSIYFTLGGRGGDLDNPSDIQALFQELESLSCDEDSGGEQDTMSISSTPKPSLRPFFSSNRSLLENNSIPFIESEKIDEKTCSGIEVFHSILTIVNNVFFIRV